jgi:hypothetical protein
MRRCKQPACRSLERRWAQRRPTGPGPRGICIHNRLAPAAAPGWPTGPRQYLSASGPPSGMATDSILQCAASENRQADLIFFPSRRAYRNCCCGAAIERSDERKTPSDRQSPYNRKTVFLYRGNAMLYPCVLNLQPERSSFVSNMATGISCTARDLGDGCVSYCCTVALPHCVRACRVVALRSPCYGDNHSPEKMQIC